MAKMFYTLDEAAKQMGVDTDQVKQMASDGRLQQFRDRDKLMFKRDQIDSMSSGDSGQTTVAGDSGAGETVSAGNTSAGDTAASGQTSVADQTAARDSSDTDAIDLDADSTHADQSGSQEDKRQATGVSVFDSNEVNQADPSAQTQVNEQQDEELALESVGSGSGLLDLTRESDDTSLGAELLDEIYPGGDESDQQSQGSIAGSSGVFEGSAAGETSSAAETSAASQAGLENLGEPSPTEPTAAQPTPTTALAAEPVDPAGSGFGSGLFIGTTITLILGLIVMVSAIDGVDNGLTQMMTAGDNSILIWSLGLLVGSAILGVIGLFVGRALGS